MSDAGTASRRLPVIDGALSSRVSCRREFSGFRFSSLNSWVMNPAGRLRLVQLAEVGGVTRTDLITAIDVVGELIERPKNCSYLDETPRGKSEQVPGSFEKQRVDEAHQLRRE